ncbi:hypothetical protein D9757_013900 [Collybiopsis confluens]|uniref:Uncharacterized protein n=1 Tax=Collybiopsis confluens TaxID=2823264 RepID=A0A8H5CNC3_9AGAR|nr:hypothetical protein D9757_013900 [Collybiopsis confluens]
MKNVIGDAATNIFASNPLNIDCKMDLQDIAGDIKHWPFEVRKKGGNSVRGQSIPEEISAVVLVRMKETAEVYLSEKVTHAVVTVPALCFHFGYRCQQNSILLFKFSWGLKDTEVVEIKTFNELSVPLGLGMGRWVSRQLLVGGILATGDNEIKKKRTKKETVISVPSKGQEYVIPPGVEAVRKLCGDEPKKDARTDLKRKGEGKLGLFQIMSIVEIQTGIGFGSKDIILQIPAKVVHPAALPEPDIPPAPEHQYSYGGGYVW